MGLYDMSGGTLSQVPTTSFQAEGVLEREHIQAAIRDNIALLGADLLVVAEEFGDFTDASRRIDLDGEELVETFVEIYPAAERNLHRWFFDTPLHDNGRTWVLSKMWGTSSQAVLAELTSLAPQPGFDVVAAE